MDTKARFSVVAVYLLLPVGELGRYWEPLFRYKLELTACLCMRALAEILVFVLYRAYKSHGSWKIENRLMHGLVHHNLLYFCCSFGSCPNRSRIYVDSLNDTAFSVGIILATVFLPVSCCAHSESSH